MLTTTELLRAVEAFAAEICADGLLGWVRHQPAPNARLNECFSNASIVASQHGGRVRYGWTFRYHSAKDIGEYLTAIHHAVWHNPADCSLVDVTPFHKNPRHQPILSSSSQYTSVYFLFDDNSQPVETAKGDLSLPVRFYAIGDDQKLKEYVARQQARELESYKREYQRPGGTVDG